MLKIKRITFTLAIVMNTEPVQRHFHFLDVLPFFGELQPALDCLEQPMDNMVADGMTEMEVGRN